MLPDCDTNKWVHFVEKSRLGVMSKVSRKNMDSNKAFCWNNESTTATNNYWRLHDWLLNNYWLLQANWLLHSWFLYYYYRWSLNNWLLLDHNLWSVVVSMTYVEEFRTEVNSACWLAIEVDLDPFLASTVLSEYRKWDLSHSNDGSL